jgi:hypothetical protein
MTTTTIKSRNTQLNKIRAQAKKDPSPNWEGHESWTHEKFVSYFRESLRYYQLEVASKDLKLKVIQWMSNNDYTNEQIKKFKNSPDWKCSSTIGAIAANLLRGMPVVRENFNNGKNSAEWLTKEIDKIIVGEKYTVEKPTETQVKQPVADSGFNIQEKIKESAGQMCEDIDYNIDTFIENPNEFNPSSIKVLNVLRGKNVKAAHARYIKTFYQKQFDELLELSSGKAEEQLREAYRHHPRKNIKKLIEFYENVYKACDQLIEEGKVNKKPRTKKAKSSEELVKSFKYCIRDDKLNLVSLNPTNLIGAQMALVYNVKTRKVGIYRSTSINGFEVKGSSIKGFTDTSCQKTLRTPVAQLKELKDQNTQKKIETWFDKNVRTIDTKLTGKFNEDVLILKTFK